MTASIDDNARTPGPHLRGIALAFAAGSLWSMGGLLIKWVQWNPLAIASSRSAIAAIVILIALRRPRLTWSASQLGAAVAYSATVISFVAANKLTTAANAILLQYTAPVYGALLGWWLLGERVARRDWLTLIIVVGGMGLFFADRLTPGGLWGNLLALVSGLCFATMTILLRKQRHGSPLGSVLLGNALTALVGLPAWFSGPPSSSTWIGIVVLGVFQLGLSYVLFAEAVRHITAVEAMLVPTIEPILNPLWVWLVLGEAPGPWATAGGAVVLTTVTVWCIVRERERRAALTEPGAVEPPAAPS